MKVIETDNLGGDYPYEKLVVECVSERAAKRIANIINAERCPNGNAPRWWDVRPDDYVLNTDGPNGPRATSPAYPRSSNPCG